LKKNPIEHLGFIEKHDQRDMHRNHKYERKIFRDSGSGWTKIVVTKNNVQQN